jgi:bifunctional DNase/RNase
MVELTIDSLRLSPASWQQVVILEEETTERYLPIWIGPAEANAIGVKLQGTAVPRPLTHDLLQSVIEALGAAVDRIVITDLEDDTFYAKIVLNVNGDRVEVDCRPSDGLALAVRVGAPIFAEESVLDEAGILVDKETGEPIPSSGEMQEMEGRSKEVSQEELKRMSAFTDFINTLDLDNLDKGES